jgi:gamma-glutamyltranspeptidase/glutathione hydrolase
MKRARLRRTLMAGAVVLAAGAAVSGATRKPVLHGRHWVAITGKPLAATAGAMTFQKGGNAVDAACAMLAATTTMFDTLSWGGETQALIFDPKAGRVVAVNALGVAPTGATPEFFRSRGMAHPPEYGPLAAVTPGTPGGLMLMLAEYGRLSLADVLAPAMQMAEGYPIERQLADGIEREKARIREWPYSKSLFLTHPGEAREAPREGEIFRQPDLHATLAKLVEAERQALASGRSRKGAILAAYDRFYRGDIAREFVRGAREQGGLVTMEDLARWKPRFEEPVKTGYKGIDVYKLDVWTQGPAMLEALNLLEPIDLKAMGYGSARYIHTLYQVMNLAFADRDFYYGDPDFPPEEPRRGLLSKDYAATRREGIDWQRNDADARPGDPYPFEGGQNPFRGDLDRWHTAEPAPAKGEKAGGRDSAASRRAFEESFHAGTTSIEAADEEGWVVSVTPSGGWNPVCIAGRTGIGMSQRMQSFVLDPAENPYNVLEPGKRPRVTLTPGMALKDGRPYLSFAVQGGDSQDQNLLQFFLEVVEFGMNVQEAAEAPHIESFQMRSSFGDHESRPGELLVNESVPPWVRGELEKMGYRIRTAARTSGPINAIFFDREHGTMWGASSDYGEDYGIAW